MAGGPVDHGTPALCASSYTAQLIWLTELLLLSSSIQQSCVEKGRALGWG